METQRIQAVTDDNFEKEVLSSTTPVLVDFWATWCPPCRALAPVVEQIAAQYQGKVRVAKLDVDENGQTALRFNVQSIPTLILFVGGAPVERIVGFMPKEQLLSRLERHLIEVGKDSVHHEFVGG